MVDRKEHGGERLAGRSHERFAQAKRTTEAQFLRSTRSAPGSAAAERAWAEPADGTAPSQRSAEQTAPQGQATAPPLVQATPTGSAAANQQATAKPLRHLHYDSNTDAAESSRRAAQGNCPTLAKRYPPDNDRPHPVPHRRARAKGLGPDRSNEQDASNVTHTPSNGFFNSGFLADLRIDLLLEILIPLLKLFDPLGIEHAGGPGSVRAAINAIGIASADAVQTACAAVALRRRELDPPTPNRPSPRQLQSRGFSKPPSSRQAGLIILVFLMLYKTYSQNR